jgi:hypothetical protein
MLPDYAEKRLQDWLVQSRRWYRFHYAVALAALALTVTVASKPSIGIRLDVLAWLAAIFQGVQTLFHPQQRAKAYRDAWRRLYLAAAQTGDAPEDDLRRAIAEGWAIISGADS